MKLQVAAFLSFLIMPYALADDQGGLKKDVAPPPPHAIEDGYRGTDDAEKMTIEQAKTLHDGATVSLRGNLIDHKGDACKSAWGTKGPIMSYSGLVAYRLSFIDIDGATVVSDPLSSQEFAR